MCVAIALLATPIGAPRAAIAADAPTRSPGAATANSANAAERSAVVPADSVVVPVPAASSAPDTVIVIRDAPLAAEAAPTDSARRSIPKTPLFDQPRMVMLRSLVVPGWGQLHNRSWIKALGFAGVESWMISDVIRDRRDLDRLNDAVLAARVAGDNDGEAVAISEYNARLDRYVGRQWSLAGVVTYAMLDAYVDAHFRNFDAEFGHDPALPEGFSPSRMRLSLRWHF